MTIQRRFESFDPEDPDGFQVEVYDHTPAEPDPLLHEMIAVGNELIRFMNSLPAGAGHREASDGRATVAPDAVEPGATPAGSDPEASA